MNRQEGTDPTGRVNARSSKCRSGVVGVGVSGAYPHSNRQVVAGDRQVPSRRLHPAKTVSTPYLHAHHTRKHTIKLQEGNPVESGGPIPCIMIWSHPDFFTCNMSANTVFFV